MSIYDVIVIGGGASGLMAAGTAAKRGLRVLLLEKNKYVGKKLNITGGGRCNIFNAETNQRKLLSFYGDAAKFLFSPFSQFATNESKDFFESKGLPIVVEANLRAFPKSQSAKDVTALMQKYAKDHGVTIKLNTEVTGFILNDQKLVGVKTKSGDLLAKSFVLATGGLAHKETGSTGEGLIWLKEIGHKIHQPNPNLVPLKTKESWVKDLSGKSLTAKVTFIDASQSSKSKFSKTGKLLFTHFGISGPVVLNSSHLVKDMLEEGPVTCFIDLRPDISIDDLAQVLMRVFDDNKNKNLASALKLCLPDGLYKAVLMQLPPELIETKVHSVTKADRQLIIKLIKALPLNVVETMGYASAIISDGGVDLKEVNTKTMSSKLYPNLFLIGDVLNVNRPSGGYSLQLCWTTGWVAGNNV